MTINLVPAYEWTKHNGGRDDPSKNSCSPNLTAIKRYLLGRWPTTLVFFGWQQLGCYGERDIRGGDVPSAHSHGAAVDLRWTRAIPDARDRARLLKEIIPFLIAYSKELGISAIHDYVGNRVWHAGRTSNVADAYTLWWKDQTGSSDPNMGKPSSGWLHVETTLADWGNVTPIASRLGTVSVPVPVPIPPPPEEAMKIRIFQPLESNAVFVAECTDDLISVNVRWSGPGDAAVGHALSAHAALGAVVHISEELATAIGATSNDPTKRPPISDLSGTWLIPPLPIDDTLHVWTGAEFANAALLNLVAA